jgi:hypothetical protein
VSPDLAALKYELAELTARLDALEGQLNIFISIVDALARSLGLDWPEEIGGALIAPEAWLEVIEKAKEADHA